MTFKERAEQAETLLTQAHDIFSELAEILEKAYDDAPVPKGSVFTDKFWKAGEYRLLRDRVGQVVECTKFLISKESE